MEEIGGIPVGLAAHLREAVVSIGPDGNVEWANDAAIGLMRIERSAFVGTNPLDRVHPDEVARALDGIAFSASAPDRTAVVPFRIRRGDDTWLDVELKSSVVSVDGGDHLVLILRDASPRQAVAEALGRVAAGAPVGETAPWLVRVIETRWKGVVAAVLIDDGDGRRLLGADRWSDELVHAVLDPVADVAWWEAAIEAGDVTIFDGEQLPAPTRRAAEAAGFTTFALAPVRDSGGGTAALMAWFDLPGAAYMEFAHASVELRELLTLALERRHHLGALDYAARHDPLTGLLNRGGFVEVADALTGELRANVGAGGEARQAALLYIDLDGFKPVNDRFGHAVGDAVLQVVANRLTALGGTWPAARIGGDEFVLLGTGSDEQLEDEAGRLAVAIVAVLSEPIDVVSDDGDEKLMVVIGASVGVAITSATDPDVHRLLERADGAMYAVKAGGGGSWSARLP